MTAGGSIGLEAPTGVAPGGIAPGVAFLRIDLPPVNVLSAAALETLAAEVARVRDARVLVVTGGPRVFSAGVEIAEHVPERGAIDRILAAMRAALSALVEIPAVTVAEVAGACLGGGAEIASACDLVIAAEDARIGFPEIRLACFPPAGASLLPLKVGEPRAADWILSGRSVSGREAGAAGFASRVVAAGALRRETARTAAEIASRSAAAIEGALAVLRANRRRALESGGSLEAAEDAYRRLAGDADLARAVADWGKAMTMPGIVYLDGRYLLLEEARVSPLDRGFLFGDAIYEVARFHRGRGFHLKEHLDRMREGLHALRIDVDPAFYPDVATRLLAENGLAEADAVVYAQVSRGAAPRVHAFPPPGTPPTIFAFARAADPPPPPAGGRTILVDDERWGRCNIKSVNLLPNILAAQRAKEAGAMDAILVRDGLALEGTKANLFAATGGRLRTAPNGPRILPGVTRAAAIAAARRMSMEVEERAFTVEEMFAADEVFFASTTLWTYSIVEVDGRPIGDGKPGPIAARLKEALWTEFTV